MTADAGGSAIGAGWFPDPAGSPWLRWWDGAAWTEHFIDPATGAPPQSSFAPAAPAAPTAAPAASPAPATSAPLTRRELRDQQTPSPAASSPATSSPATSSPAAFPVDDSHVTAATAPIATQSPFGQLLPVDQPAQPAAPAIPAAPAQPAAPAIPAAPAEPTAPFAPTLAGPAYGQSWTTAPPPKMEDAYFPPREQPYLPPHDPFYEPMVNPRTTVPQAAQEVAPGAVSTVAIWLYAVLPILHVALAWFVVEKLKLTDLGALRWAIIAGPIVIYLILAAVDRRRLLARGHVYLASALLAILPPLYLGIRAARMGARAVAPAIVWVLLQAAGIAVLVSLFPGVITQLTAADISTAPTIQPLPTADTHVLTPAERATLLTPAGMAAGLKSEFASKGVALTSVTCPALANTTDGTQVICLGVLPISKLDILVSVDNVNTLAAFDIISSVPHQGN